MGKATQPVIDCLAKEALAIIRHYKGKLELHVTERMNTVNIQILAGKRYDFELTKNEIKMELED